MRYEADIITPSEEQQLLTGFDALLFHEARYKEWHAKRRIVSYGGQYDFSRNVLLPAEPIPAFLEPLRERIAGWSGIDAQLFQQTLIAEYRPGTQLGWHRDVPDFEVVVAVSLAGPSRLRFRPWPPRKGARADTIAVDVKPRSAYLLAGPARWQWQHAVSPVRTLRYSVTFRTRRNTPCGY